MTSREVNEEKKITYFLVATMLFVAFMLGMFMERRVERRELDDAQHMIDNIDHRLIAAEDWLFSASSVEGQMQQLRGITGELVKEVQILQGQCGDMQKRLKAVEEQR